MQQYAYTLDGGEAGTFEDETFSADAVHIKIHGVIAHPGYAKDKLVNAIKIAGEIVAALPAKEWSPETTFKARRIYSSCCYKWHCRKSNH